MTGQGRVGLVDELTALLRERLYAGRYPAGSVISQAATAAELGVSRTPLREALRLLAAEGLLRPDPAGAQVVGMSRERWLAAVEVRAALDAVAAGLCAEIVARRPDGPEARTLRALSCEVDPQRIGADEQDFHLALVRASGNEFLAEQVTVVRRTTVLAEPLLPLDRTRAQGRTAEHRAVLGAVLAGDRGAAEEAARRHQWSVRDQVRACC